MQTHPEGTAPARRRAYPSTASLPPPLSSGTTTNPRRSNKRNSLSSGIASMVTYLPWFGLAGFGYYVLHFLSSRPGPPSEVEYFARVSNSPRAALVEEYWGGHGKSQEGHWDFGDGRAREVEEEWVGGCEECYWVNTNLGNGGPEPDLSGGMIPAVAPPFAMTRWTPQTRQNYVSMCPYNQTDTTFHGFLGTHQPAVWMGESGQMVISPGLGDVVTDFDERGLHFWRDQEYASVNYYRTVLEHEQSGLILAEMSSSTRVGHFRFTFKPDDKRTKPHIVIQASRPSVIMSGNNVFNRATTNVSYPNGHIEIDQERNEVSGWNDERQDRILLSEQIPASGFRGYFVARFSDRFDSGGIAQQGKLHQKSSGEGKELSGWVTFPGGTEKVDVRVGVSFISVEQARRNLDTEIANGQSLEQTSRRTRSSWAEKLDALSVTSATPQNLTVLYTSFAHTLVYPYIISEPTLSGPAYYSGYLDRVVAGTSYSGYSIWDTFRAQTAWLLLLAPERVGGMITSMLQDYKEGGWLPMWKNLVETNIMVGTFSDSIIAQAMEAGIKHFDYDLAWEAVQKNAYTPPDRDIELRFEDREEHTPQEARAGLTEYIKLGYVAADLHSESGSRTLDYSYDDWAASIVAKHVGADEEASALLDRSQNYKQLWNAKTGHMEARNSDGSWAGQGTGWTEGDHWAYSLDVMHDVPGLIELMGGTEPFLNFVDRHFDGGHNLHTNEPSHHIPYLYAYAGEAHKTQEAVLKIGREEYNHTAGGLSGNEDCGQMSAWYLFSAMGFYPVDPASAIYTIGTPFFDELTLRLPGAARPLHVISKGASEGKKYIRSVSIDGRGHNSIFIKHAEIANGAEIVFEMSDVPEIWGHA